MRRDPFAADPRPAAVNALAYFTDREGFQEAFLRHAEMPSAEDLSVLVFYGVGGIGKTTLLRKLCANLDHSSHPLPYVRFNLENVSDQTQAYRDVLLRLRSDFESDCSLSFPRFDLALSVLLALEGGQRPALVKISPGLDEAFKIALELTPGVVKAGVKVAGNQLKSLIQRSDLVERWVRHVGGTEAVQELSEQFAQDDRIILEELIRRFAQDLAAALPERPGKTCRGVLFLDTYEALWTGREDSLSAQARRLDDWVRMLAEYLLGAGVLLVIAGRDRLGWADTDPDWEGCLDQHLLGGVSISDAQTFLARRGIGVPPPLASDLLQAEILRCANTASSPHAEPSCHLLALALSADIVVNTRLAGSEPAPALFRGVPPARLTSELATRFLKSLHNRNLELWVEALSLTPRFDEAAALALDAERQLHAGRAGWEQLRHYSFVTSQPDGFFRLHRTMREVLRTRSSVEVATALHQWFAHYWQERGETGLAFYHHWSIDPAGELRDWSERHTDTVTVLRIDEARRLLTDWSEIDLDGDDRPMLDASVWADAHAALGTALETTPQRPRLARLTAAIDHYQAALSVWTEAAFPDCWAEVQNQLGVVYLNLPTADRAGSLRQAEECFQAALRVATEAHAPTAWAKIQANLGLACAYRTTGERAQNIRESLGYFEAAQRVWTQADYPQKWANIQNNRGCNFLLMPGDDRAASLRQAAALFEANLESGIEETSPALWAKTHHNLGFVYCDLPEGDRVANLHRATSHYHSALRVHTEDDLPDVWAETQNSLGFCYAALPASETTLRQAIACYEASQRVWTEAENPERWAQSQTNLGKAAAGLPEGDRAEHLAWAVACYRNALRIHTEQDFPENWAAAQKHLGLALQSLASLPATPASKRAELIEEARFCFTAAARGYHAVGLHTDAEESERLAEAARETINRG